MNSTQQVIPGQPTNLPYGFITGSLHDPNTWNMETGASSHLNSLVTSLSNVFNTCMYRSISVGDGHSNLVTNTGHSMLPTPTKSLHLNIVLLTPHIIKNLISVRQFVHDNNCTIEFDAFGFSVKDFLTRLVLLRCDSTGDLYPVTAPCHIPHAFFYLAYGTLSRYKARLVVNGSTQLEGVDVDETFSSVVKPGTIWTVLSLAASRHWPIHQLDVKNAFLHAVSIWAKTGTPSLGTDTAYLLLYVDDIVLTASSESLLQQIIRSLHQEFAITDLGPLNYILGISVTRDSSGFRTPIDTESKLGSDGDPISDPTLYRSLADWAGCHTTRRSTSGYCIFLGNNILSWSSNHEPMLSCSSAKAEYRGVTNVVAKTFYLSCNLVQHQCTKHIEIDIHFIHDLVADGQVRVLHVPSCYQYAYIFTKELPSTLFEEFHKSLSVWCSPALNAGGVLVVGLV
ncbi:ribonuclease H-like domain-containing protein [Tanacetum coccineum]